MERRVQQRFYYSLMEWDRPYTNTTVPAPTQRQWHPFSLIHTRTPTHTHANCFASTPHPFKHVPAAPTLTLVLDLSLRSGMVDVDAHHAAVAASSFADLISIVLASAASC